MLDCIWVGLERELHGSSAGIAASLKGSYKAVSGNKILGEKKWQIKYQVLKEEMQ